MSGKLQRFTCHSCGARFDFAENVGTTSRYIEFCPACGVQCHGDEIAVIDVSEHPRAGLLPE